MLCERCEHEEKDHAPVPKEVSRGVPRPGRYCTMPLCSCVDFIRPKDEDFDVWGDPEVTKVL
jgi:hypothetical protein